VLALQCSASMLTCRLVMLGGRALLHGKERCLVGVLGRKEASQLLPSSPCAHSNVWFATQLQYLACESQFACMLGDVRGVVFQLPEQSLQNGA
jgi:hypothetical protein